MFVALFLIACAPVTVEGQESVSSERPLAQVVVDTHGIDVDDEALWGREDRPWISSSTRFYALDDSGTALVETPSWEGSTGIHVRGNSSAHYEKKSYALETWDSEGNDLDVSLLGLPEEEDWVLQGPFSDKSLMRNHLAYTWSRSIDRYAARTVFVELYVVDDEASVPTEDHYRGVYVLMEKIKRDDNRVDLAKLRSEDLEEPEVTGGYLLKRDWVEGDGVLETAVYGDVLLLEDPDPASIAPEQREWIQTWLDDFERMLSSPGWRDPETGYAAWIDVDSFIDYALLIELCRNVDGFVLSTWLRKDREGLLAMGPVWDFNGALGNADYFEAQDPEGWHVENPEFPADNENGYAWYARLMEDSNYRDRMGERWRSHRGGAWSDAALLGEIAAVRDRIGLAADRNFERWPVLGQYVWPNAEGWEERTSFEEEVAYLEAWVLARVAWMDEALAR